MNHIQILLLDNPLANFDRFKSLIYQIQLVRYLCDTKRHYVSTEIGILLPYLFEKYQACFVIAFILFDLSDSVNSSDSLLWVCRI